MHFSDTHLGYSDLDKLTADGTNQREQDMYEAFRYVIDQTITLKPDVVVHSGDFFHRPSPPNRPMIFALEQLKRLSVADIPIIIIAGNHSTPRTIYTSPILQAFRTIEGVYPIFGQAYERFEFGDLAVHGLPHINDENVLHAQMDRIQPVKGMFNILMLHTSIGQRFMMEEYGEQLFPEERISLLDRFDYVALGHWHNFQKVKKLKTGWYSGSTERMSDTEAGKTKGFCTIELGKKKIVQPSFHPIPARPWNRLDIGQCEQKSILEIEQELIDWVAQQDSLEGSLLSLYFHNVQGLQALNLPNHRIAELIPGPLHIYIKRNFANDLSARQSISPQTESMDQLISSFINEHVEDKELAKRLAQKANYYFDLYESGEYKNR